MKLFRFDKEGKPGLGYADNNGNHYDISASGYDLTEISIGSGVFGDISAWIQANQNQCKPLPAGFRFLSCIGRPSKIICVGLNYAKHAEESGMAAPKEPVIFFKSTTALCGPNDPVIIPRGSVKTDWEVELAVVIGKKASYVTKADAMSYVAGYCLHNDYSEREYQLERGGQWVKGKSCDSFAPMGPYFVTTDDVKDPHNLHLWLDVNGKRMQDSSTSDLIFDIPHLVSYISEFMTLLPGDVISTGTPAGVGLGQKPEPWYLKPGDVVRLGIEGLGEQQQTAVAYAN